MHLDYRFHTENENLVFKSELQNQNDCSVHHCFEKGSRSLQYWYTFEESKFNCKLQKVSQGKWKADVRGDVVFFKEAEISAQYIGSIKNFGTLVELVPESLEEIESLTKKGITFSGISL